MTHPSKPNGTYQTLTREIDQLGNLLKCFKDRMLVGSRPSAQRQPFRPAQNGYPCFPNTTQSFRNGSSHHYYNRAKYTYDKRNDGQSNRTLMKPTEAISQMSSISINPLNLNLTEGIVLNGKKRIVVQRSELARTVIPDNKSSDANVNCHSTVSANKDEKELVKSGIPPNGSDNLATSMSVSSLESESLSSLNFRYMNNDMKCLDLNPKLYQLDSFKKRNHSTRLISTKYKVINKNTTSHNVPRKLAEKGLLSNVEAVTPNKNDQNILLRGKGKSRRLSVPHLASSSKKIVKTAFKIVNKKNPVPNLNVKIDEIGLKTPEAKRLLMQRIKLLTSQQNACSKSEVLHPQPGVSKIRMVTPETDSKSTACLKQLMNVKGSHNIDLTNVPPEELLDLDSMSLLKLSVMVKPSEKKQKTFVKRTKYTLSKHQASVDSKKKPVQWSSGSRDGSSRHPFSGMRSPHLKMGNRKKTGKVSYGGRYSSVVQVGDLSYRKRIAKMHRNNGKSTVVVVRGVRFQMDTSGKSLKKIPDKQNNSKTIRRIDLGGKTYIGTAAGTYTATPAKAQRTLASRAVHRSIRRVVAATKKNEEQKLSYCMFYNRFGKCNRQSECPYIHDPSKIAVCTRYLRGTCKRANCQFSHERNPGKMAICSFYLQGKCKIEECPYRHEMIKPGTKLCQDFVKGYCADGKECKMAHILVCPQYIIGKCTKNPCLYPHPPQKERKKEMENTEKLEAAETTSAENRYFSLNSELEVDPPHYSHFSISRRNDAEEVQALPAYIPLSFDHEDCVR